MIQRRQHLRLAAKPRQAFAVGRERGGQELDRDATAELGVGGLVDFAHAAGSQVGRDFVVGEFGSDHGQMKMRGGSYQSLRTSLRDLELSGERFDEEKQVDVDRVHAN